MRKELGITLVALVITVIILLILAGVTMSKIAGPEGLFAKADYAATEYKRGALNEAIKYNESDDLMGQYIEIIPEDSVKYLLKVNINGATEKDKSPYVLYKDKNGNNIRCRVLYSDDTNGVQLVSEDIVTTFFPLSNIDNKETAINKINNLVITLNEKAEEYMNSKTTEYARCIGSDPVNPNILPTKTPVRDTDLDEFLNHAEIAVEEYDPNHLFWNENEDYIRLCAIGAADIIIRDESGSIPKSYYNYSNSNCNTKTYVFASLGRSENPSQYRAIFNIYIYYIGGEWDWGTEFTVERGYQNQLYVHWSSNEYNIRPVFKLKNTVRVVDGEGTYENPYVLSL